MIKLEISQLDKEPVFSGFTCGVDSIDRKVKRSYFPHVLRQAKTFKIELGERKSIAGYYQISICTIKTDHSNIEFGDYGDYGEGEPEYTAMKMEFLAIDERLQQKGIGTEVLRSAVREAKELGKKWPIRVFLIDALVGKTEWYKNRGFQVFSEKQEMEYGTVRMFFDLMDADEKKKVAAYTEEI